MSNHWKIPGIPHRGWTLIDVEDIRDDGQPEDETDYEACMMCGHEPIRYIHIVTHPEVNGEFRVGCDCAEKMTNDYVNPGRLENYLRNKSNRRKAWVNKEWKISQKGNRYIKVDGHILTIYRDKKTNQFRCMLDKKFGELSYTVISQAKVALFNKVEHLKLKGAWEIWV